MRRAFNIIQYMCTVSILLSMASCRLFNSEDETKYDRTILVYMAAENSLSWGEFHEQDIDEMLQATQHIPKGSQLLIYLDDTELPRILTIEQQEGRRPVRKVLKQYDTEHNSGDAQTLHEVMNWTVSNYPSSSYGLVLWSHGDAWLPAKAPIQRTICIDNEHNSHSNSGTKMEIEDVAAALDDFPRLDFILFDACFMQAVEVAYELRHVAKYIVSSPAEIPNPGAPYERLVEPMFSSPLNMEQIIDEYYRAYNDTEVLVWDYGTDRYGALLSVVDCDYLESLATATAEMLSKYLTPDRHISLNSVQSYYPISSRTRPMYHDMNGFMKTIITSQEDYTSWKRVFDLTVPYRRATSWWYSNDARTQHVDMKNYGGLSCYIPQDNPIYSGLNAKFTSTSWYKAAGWNEIGN